jgi:hypothetical protein
MVVDHELDDRGRGRTIGRHVGGDEEVGGEHDHSGDAAQRDPDSLYSV